MTLQELYENINGNYEHALQIMRMDKLIDRYVRKLGSSSSFDNLMAAGTSMDPTALFESAHALKGVCANLGLDALAENIGVITEEFRPGNTRALSDEVVKEKLQEISGMYRKTLEGIQAYEESQQ